MWKLVLNHLKTTKKQISLRIRAFIVHYLDSVTPVVVISENTRLASIAKRTDCDYPGHTNPKMTWLIS